MKGFATDGQQSCWGDNTVPHSFYVRNMFFWYFWCRPDLLLNVSPNRRGTGYLSTASGCDVAELADRRREFHHEDGDLAEAPRLDRGDAGPSCQRSPSLS
jgi:hypothetical protein